MASDPTDNVALLPERARVLHIGPPKTGTTTIQYLAGAERQALLEHGVSFVAGKRRRGVAAFMGRGFGWETDEGRAVAPPPIRYWHGVKHDIEHETERRVWLSQEQIAHSSDETARRWREELGPRLQIVMTLRPLSAMVPSIWQQTLKGVASREGFDTWLKRALTPGTPANLKLLQTYDQGGLVRRWSAVVGAENVTVIVLDSADHSFLPASFERLFGLPDGLLSKANLPTRAVNRSMTAAEVEMIRQLNRKLRAADVDWRDHDWLVTRGAVSRLLNERRPGADEAKLTMPDWAATMIRQSEERFVEEIDASGVRVLGDLSRLVAPLRPRRSEAEDHQSVTMVPLDAAVEAMLGIISVSTGYDYRFQLNEHVVMKKLKADARHTLPAVKAIGVQGWHNVLGGRLTSVGRSLKQRFKGA